MLNSFIQVYKCYNIVALYLLRRGSTPFSRRPIAPLLVLLISFLLAVIILVLLRRTNNPLSIDHLLTKSNEITKGNFTKNKRLIYKRFQSIISAIELLANNILWTNSSSHLLPRNPVHDDCNRANLRSHWEVQHKFASPPFLKKHFVPYIRSWWI